MQREALEGANTNTAVLTTMKNAADALKSAHQNMYVLIDLDIFQYRIYTFKFPLGESSDNQGFTFGFLTFYLPNRRLSKILLIL